MTTYNFDFFGTTYTYPLYEEDKDKYVIFTCAKNEDEYIEEFIKHHLDIGFDKIFIADNNDDNTKLPILLERYIKDGTVQIFECCGLKQFQTMIYSMFMQYANYKWCGYFDVDEFLEITGDYYDVKDMLDNTFGDCLCVNWIVYGSNGEILQKNEDIQKRFSKPIYPINTFKENMFIKCILKNTFNNGYFETSHTPKPANNGEYFYNIGDKLQTWEYQVNYPLYYKKCYLKHYYTKSLEEYANKINRGWPDKNDVNILNDFSHYILLDNNNHSEIYRQSLALFGKVTDGHREKLVNQYKTFVLTSNINNYYALLLEASRLFLSCKNHLFIVDKNIDNSIFNTLLEFAIETNNRIVASDINDNRVYKVLQKETDNGYYRLDVF